MAHPGCSLPLPSDGSDRLQLDPCHPVRTKCVKEVDAWKVTLVSE